MADETPPNTDPDGGYLRACYAAQGLPFDDAHESGCAANMRALYAALGEDVPKLRVEVNERGHSTVTVAEDYPHVTKPSAELVAAAQAAIDRNDWGQPKTAPVPQFPRDPVSPWAITATFAPSPDGDGFTVYGMRTSNGWPQAKLTAATVCGRCGGRIGKGHVVTADLAVPPAEATWHHNDCADPTLAEEI